MQCVPRAQLRSTGVQCEVVLGPLTGRSLCALWHAACAWSLALRRYDTSARSVAACAGRGLRAVSRGAVNMCTGAHVMSTIQGCSPGTAAAACSCACPHRWSCALSVCQWCDGKCPLCRFRIRAGMDAAPWGAGAPAASFCTDSITVDGGSDRGRYRTWKTVEVVHGWESATHLRDRGGKSSGVGGSLCWTRPARVSRGAVALCTGAHVVSTFDGAQHVGRQSCRPTCPAREVHCSSTAET